MDFSKQKVMGLKIYNGVYSVLRFITGSPTDSSRRRTLRYLIFFVIVVVANILLGKNITNNRYPWYANVSIFLLLNINIILVLVLFIVLFRNIAKLMADRRKRIFGARLQTKLVIFSVILVVIPVFTTYFMSNTFIRGSIDRWFDSNVNRMVYNAYMLSVSYRDYTVDNMIDQSEVIAESIGRLRQLANGRLDVTKSMVTTQDYIDKKVINAVALYDDSRLVYVQQNTAGVVFDFIDRSTVNSILAGEKRGGFEGEVANPAFWAGVPVYKGDNIIGALFILKLSSPELTEDIHEIAGMYELFRQLRFYSHPVRTAFNVSHFLIALLVVFASIWGSMIFVRSISNPLKSLAIASQKLSKGMLDTRVEVSGNDEITLLSKSFNDMASRLNQHTLELEHKNMDLNNALSQISRDKLYIDTIYRNVDSALILLDKELNILKLNKYAEDLMARENNISQEFARKELRTFMESNETERIVQATIEFDGEPRLFIAHINKIMDEAGNIENILLVLDDNTHVMNLQRITLWKEIATRITHEIKNPLTPIKLTAERVKRRSEEITSPAVKDLVNKSMQTIIVEVDELIDLVEEFNLYARMPSMIRVDISLLPLVREVVELQKRAAGAGISINVDIPEDITVQGDRHQLKRVLVNLIQNAIQALDNGGEINISARRDHENAVSLIVEDNGSGIKEEDMGNIFVPYFSKKPTGTGLGLAIVKKIIEEHGGDIKVESRSGEFTRFHIHLP